NPVDSTRTGTYTSTYNVSDAVGNSAAQVTRTVVVEDTLPPVPNVASLLDVTGQCSASVTAPTATDACDGAITATTTNATSYSSQGDFVVYWTYTDGHGNSVTQPQNVKVHDTTLPVVTCPDNITVVTTNTDGMSVTFTPTATDNCSVASVVAVPASGSNFPIGSNQVVTVTATDINGNSSQCNFTVTVVLNHAPIADDITMGAVENHSRNLLVEKVDAHCFDQDNDPMTITVRATSTNGGTVTLSPTAITSTPVANFVGTDAFTYTVNDGRGGTVTA